MKLFRLTAIAGLAAIMSVSAMAGISTTKHNLGSGAPAANPNYVSDTSEICVFCHTPHGGDTDAPLWNKVMQTTDLTGYTSTTLDGSAVLAGSPSLACLSCHDGQQAMDTMINAPSTASDYNFTDIGQNMAYTWTNGAEIMGNGAGDLVPMLGTDLRNDHPVAVPYAGGGMSTGVVANTDFADPDFNSPDEATIGGQQVWWLDTEAAPNGTREKTDIILYTRQYGFDKAGAPVALYDTGFVECASCHDPHVANPQFLRPTVASSGVAGNGNSQVCLACHNK